MIEENATEYSNEHAPYFSILLPTRNRPHLAEIAIKSLINQEFTDFEVILSDNSDGNLTCREMVDRINNPRIRYYRTSGELSMPDNWEFALAQARGVYLAVLEDKQVYFPNTLALVRKVIDAMPDCKSVCWHNDILDDSLELPTLVHYVGSGEIAILSCEEMLLKLTEGLNGWSKVPRMINSVLCLDFINSFKEEFELKRFFIDVSPDICASFIQMAEIESVAYVDQALCITGGVKHSNGRAALAKSNPAQTEEFLKKIKNQNQLYSHVELKGFLMPGNSIINDYLRLRDHLGSRLLKYTFSKNAYARICLRDLIRSFSMGGQIRNEARMLLKYIRNHFGKIEIFKMLVWAVRMYSNVQVNKQLLNYPRVANVIYKLRGTNTRLYASPNILDASNDEKFRPNLNRQPKGCKLARLNEQ